MGAWSAGRVPPFSDTARQVGEGFRGPREDAESEFSRLDKEMHAVLDEQSTRICFRLCELLALGIPREDPISVLIDQDRTLERALTALTWPDAVQHDLRKLELELTRARADAVNTAERMGAEHRRQASWLGDW